MLVDWIWLLLAFLNSTMIYVIMYKFPRKNIYVWVFGFTSLLIVKIYDTWYNWLRWGSPGPGIFMMLLCKQTMTA